MGDRGRLPAGERILSKNGSIATGLGIAAVGTAIVALAIFGPADKFDAPRWVVGAVGGAFLFFGGWTAVVYALGFDPRRPDDTLPSPGLQLLFFVPGMSLFAAPFHWVAFGPGPRRFSTTFSLPFMAVRSGSGETSGRLVFGIGAILVDLLIVAIVVRLARKMVRGGTAAP
jgi:hypothetical protein